MSASVCIFILLIAERAEQENGRKEISSNAFANLTFHSCHNLIFCPFLCLAGLLKHYNTSHPDYQNTNMAMVKIQSVIRKMSVKLRESVRKNTFLNIFRLIYKSFAGEFCQIG